MLLDKDNVWSYAFGRLDRPVGRPTVDQHDFVDPSRNPLEHPGDILRLVLGRNDDADGGFALSRGMAIPMVSLTGVETVRGRTAPVAQVLLSILRRLRHQHLDCPPQLSMLS